MCCNPTGGDSVCAKVEVETSLGTSPDEIRRTSTEVEVSVVIPCLNEANSLGICIKKALAAFAKDSLRGEVVVADNGSTDGSIEIAETCGARVVRVPIRGYGAALQAGITASK